MAKKNILVSSILDLNNSNIWTLDEFQIASLWEETKKEENFTSSEGKLLNVIRQAFEVVHYNPQDRRECEKYENGEWAIMTHCKANNGVIAIRRKTIASLSDLTHENIKHITAPTLLELINRNFGGGWDSISSTIKEIIESGFEISTTQLPASRIHSPGGTWERKVSDGFDVLEIKKGNWVEAIFAKAKDEMDLLAFDELDNDSSDENDMNADEDDLTERSDSYDRDDDTSNDEIFYDSYAAEAEIKDEDSEGFGLEDDSDL